MNNEYSELMKAVLGVPGPVVGIGWHQTLGPGNHFNQPVRKLWKEHGIPLLTSR